MRQPPQIVLLAGPNGAGKSTAAAAAIGRSILVDELVNADDIAKEIAPDEPERAAFDAGRRALERIDALIAARANFAFETTLSARSYVHWLGRAAEAGYRIQMHFFWLPNPEQAVARVEQRVEMGGHGIPADAIHRRYFAGIRNFLGLYRGLADEWTVYDSSNTPPLLVAEGERGRTTRVSHPRSWASVRRFAGR